MQSLNKTLGGILALGLLGALGVSGYLAFKRVTARFGSMGFQTAVTSIASVVVLLAVTIVASSIRQASPQNKANQFRAAG